MKQVLDGGSNPPSSTGGYLKKYLALGEHGFDRAKSNRVDSTVGDDRKSSKTKVSANDDTYLLAANA